MIFIFCKNTERFVKITKRYLNHCQQTGFIHPAHPKHNYQAVKPKAGTRLCLHMHDYSHSFQRLHCPVEISALQASQLGLPMWNHLFSPWFVTVLWMLWPFFFCFWIFFISKSLKQIKTLCPELVVAGCAAIMVLVLPSAVGVSCS